MGSSYFGVTNPGNERSSRKGKKSSRTNVNMNAENNKPKNPQRGLGVAQLEKIILQTQLASTYSSTPTLSQTYVQEDVKMQTQGYPSVVPPSSLPYAPSSASSSSYGFHVPQKIMVGLNKFEGNSTRYGESRPSIAPRWNQTSNGILETQQFARPSVTRHFLNPQSEDLVQKRINKGWFDSIGASSQNAQTSDTQELDLELRL